MVRDRRILIPLLAAAALLLPGSAGARSAGDPTITLLTPANGSTVYSAIWMSTYPTFTWRIDWPDVAASTTNATVLVSVTTATDQWFTQGVTQENHMCPIQNLNCWSYAPHAVWGNDAPAKGNTWYWRVGVDTDHGFVYQSASFVAKPPPDTTPPRVRALVGSARRGDRPEIDIRATDTPQPEVKFRVSITGHGRTLLSGTSDFEKVSWDTVASFTTLDAIPRSTPAGRYSLCVVGYDHAGHKSPRSCAAFTVR